MMPMDFGDRDEKWRQPGGFAVDSTEVRQAAGRKILPVLLAAGMLAAGRWTAAETNAHEPRRFSQLPRAVQRHTGLFDPLTAAQTDNPFAFFAHNEFPAAETLQLIAGMGMGVARVPQHPAPVLVPLAKRLGIDLVVQSHMPRQPDAFAAINGAFNGQIRYYQTDGDEPNNPWRGRGIIKVEDFMARMQRASRAIRAADPHATIIMDDLGDENPVAYLNRCIAAGLGKYVDEVSYGYFTWGHAKELFFAIRNAAQPAGLKVCCSPLYKFCRDYGSGAVHVSQKHLIDMFFCGADLINIYKLFDYSEPYSLMRFDGGFTPNYAGFQTLCQVFGRRLAPIPPEKLSITMKVTGKIPPDVAVDLAGLTCEAGPGDGTPPGRPRIWIRPFGSSERLLITYWFGPMAFAASRNDHPTTPCGARVALTVGTNRYAYPVAIDMLTGRLEDLPYTIEAGRVRIQSAPLDSFARAVLLLRRHRELEAAAPYKGHLRQRRPRTWRTLTDIPGIAGGDWVSAILPRSDGGAILGLTPMHTSADAIIYVDQKLRVTRRVHLKDANSLSADYTFPPGRDVSFLLRQGASVIAAGRGNIMRFDEDDPRRNAMIPPPADAPQFQRREITGMLAWKNRLWFAAVGTTGQGKPNLGEGVSVLDPASDSWTTYTHGMPQGLPDPQQRGGGQFAGRITGITQAVNGVCISAMNRAPALYNGIRWIALAGPSPNWCVAGDESHVVVGGTSCAWIYKRVDPVRKKRPAKPKQLSPRERRRTQRAAARRKRSSSSGLRVDLTPDSAGEHLVKFVDNQGRNLWYATVPLRKYGITGRVLHAAVADGVAWLATRYGGVCSIDLDSGDLHAWKAGENGLPTAMIRGILPVGNHVWVWSWGGGIAKLNTSRSGSREAGTWTVTTRRGGLADNRVSTLVEDADGTVWVGTFRGLSVRRGNAPRRRF